MSEQQYDLHFRIELYSYNFILARRGRDIIEVYLDPIEREEFMRFIYKESKKRKIKNLTAASQYGRVGSPPT